MAYGETNLFPEDSVGAFSVRDMSGEGVYLPQIEFTSGRFNGGEAPAEEVAALFQKILTLVESHPDLSVISAGRTFRASQDVTP
jgi:hypothetical protein